MSEAGGLASATKLVLRLSLSLFAKGRTVRAAAAASLNDTHLDYYLCILLVGIVESLLEDKLCSMP